MDSPWRAALLAGALCFAWMAFQARALYGGNWTGLFYLSADRTTAEELARGAYLRPAGRGYDGQFYRAIAHDPWPPFRLDSQLDAPAYRRQRMLVPTLAWLAALGRAEWIGAAYMGVVLGSVMLAVYFTAAWFARRGRSAGWGCLALALPPVVASVDRMCVDATLLALTMAAAVLWERGRTGWLWMTLALAGLTRETGVLLAAGAALGEWRRAGPCRALVLLSAAMPALAWGVLLAAWAGSQPAGTQFRFLYLGVLEMLGRAEAGAPLAVRALNTAGLIGLSAAIPIALRWAWTGASRGASLGALAAFFVPLSLALGGRELLESPVAYGRFMGPLLAFVLFEAVVRRGWSGAAAVGAVCAGPLAYSAAALLRGLGLMAR
jgi:hypothetical protein